MSTAVASAVPLHSNRSRRQPNSPIEEFREDAFLQPVSSLQPEEPFREDAFLQPIANLSDLAIAHPAHHLSHEEFPDDEELPAYEEFAPAGLTPATSASTTTPPLREDQFPIPVSVATVQASTPPAQSRTVPIYIPEFHSEQESGVILSSDPPPVSSTTFPLSPTVVPSRAIPRRRPVPSRRGESDGSSSTTYSHASGSSSSTYTIGTAAAQTPPSEAAAAGKKVIAYMVPFPKPRLACLASMDMAEQFFIYTTPQTRWLDDTSAETATDTTSSDGSKKAQKARQKRLKTVIKDSARAGSVGGTFLSRLPVDKKASACSTEAPATTALSQRQPRPFTELIVAYPASSTSNEKEVHSTFMHSLLEWEKTTSSHPQAVAKALTKRLTHSCICGHHAHERLDLTVKAAVELEVLKRYLARRCWDVDQRLFAHPGIMAPSERDVLDSIGWEPVDAEGGEGGVVVDAGCKNGKKKGEEELLHWEVVEMQADLKALVQRAAKEWVAACRKVAKEFAT